MVHKICMWVDESTMAGRFEYTTRAPPIRVINRPSSYCPMQSPQLRMEVAMCSWRTAATQPSTASIGMERWSHNLGDQLWIMQSLPSFHYKMARETSTSGDT